MFDDLGQIASRAAGRLHACLGRARGIRFVPPIDSVTPAEGHKIVPLNARALERWQEDTAVSVAMYNEWFLEAAPAAYHDVRESCKAKVLWAMECTDSFRRVTGQVLLGHPGILPVLRLACSPPLAVDRLMGLAGVSKQFVKAMEKGRLPARMPKSAAIEQADSAARVIRALLDQDLFPWLPWLVGMVVISNADRVRAAAVVADRLTSSIANPVIRGAQERRQLDKIKAYLEAKGYREDRPKPGAVLRNMSLGTFAFQVNIAGGDGGEVKVPIDVVIQPLRPRPSGLPLMVEAKSAGDFTNVNKRRKEEASKARQLRAALGDDVDYLLLLGGYFDRGYLSYEATAGIDWIWEHRLEDLEGLGV